MSVTVLSEQASTLLAREQAIFDALDLPLIAGKTGELPGIFDGQWKKGQSDHSLQSQDPSTGRLTAIVQGVSISHVAIVAGDSRSVHLLRLAHFSSHPIRPPTHR